MASVREHLVGVHVGAGAGAGLEDVEREVGRRTRPRRRATAEATIGIGDVVGKHAEVAVDLGRGRLDQRQRADLRAAPGGAARSGSSPPPAASAPGTWRSWAPGPRPWCRARCGTPLAPSSRRHRSRRCLSPCQHRNGSGPARTTASAPICVTLRRGSAAHSRRDLRDTPAAARLNPAGICVTPPRGSTSPRADQHRREPATLSAPVEVDPRGRGRARVTRWGRGGATAEDPAGTWRCPWGCSRWSHSSSSASTAWSASRRAGHRRVRRRRPT